MADQEGLALTALGTASAYRAHEGARASSYLVQAGGSSIVLDLGHGAYVPLARTLGRELLPTIDAVCVSHLHPDHWIDLIALRHALYHGSGMHDGVEHRSVKLFGPAGLDDRIAALLDVTPQWNVAMHGAEIDPPFNFTQWGEAAKGRRHANRIACGATCGRFCCDARLATRSRGCARSCLLG